MRKWYIRAIVIEVIVLAFLLVLGVSLGKIDGNQSNDETASTMQSSSLADDGVVDDPFGSTGSDNSTTGSTSAPATGAVTSTPLTSTPTQSTTPATSKPTSTPPTSGSTQPPVSQPAPTTPSTGATEPSGGTEEMTYEKYINMSASEQKAYRNTFENVTAFFEWYNQAKAEYDAQKPNVDVGDGPIDLGGGNG